MERPILFSAPMVRALLDGSKTQTRRIAVKPVRHPDLGNLYTPGAFVLEQEPQHVIERACPHGALGDRLWVREAFVQGWRVDPANDSLLQYGADGHELPMTTWYRATDNHITWSDDDGWQTDVPWKPSIHMPRAACRLLLEITDVRIERLQDISDADCVAEGCGATTASIGTPMTEPRGETVPRAMFRALWESINGADSWATNPWVWALTFKRAEGTQP